jgi:class 3 adenylate cyclase
MEQIIRIHRGYVDNYMGDGLLAIFGSKAPETAPFDEVLAGIEMLDTVEKLAPFVLDHDRVM